ncbi:MAG: hypothetical protein QNJ60_03800 [Xenococcaceae cyanobacterium MO_188.B19]|nr:hypothetical protein [Xenococcaceae cyanobacterium MO_188.B19]
MVKTNLIAGFNNNLNFLAFSLFLTTLFSATQSAVAQLRLGRGIQPGLEGHLIEYQLQGQPLGNMRGIQGCSVGFGTKCNKTAALLQKIILENSGTTYQDLILKASGGLENYQNFLKYYPSAKDISSVTSDSFWVNASPYILDRYEYSGIGVLEPVSSKELYEIVSNFNSTSVTQNKNSLNLREGMIGLKTAYGRTILEEAQKIPNIEAKITEYGLNSIETAFHLQQFRYAVATLESNNYENTNFALYKILSNPYTDIPGEFNRPSLKINPKLDTLDGNTLEGESYIKSFIEGNAGAITLFNNPEVIVTLDESEETALYATLGGIGFTVLIIALVALNSDSQSSSTIAQSNGESLSLFGDSTPLLSSPTDDLNNPPGIIPDIVIGQPTVNPNNGEIASIPEPSVNPYILTITLLMLLALNKMIKARYSS